MRIWHKDLIPYLPRKQLIRQWRECCLIAKGIAENETPNHLLVNKVMDYPLEHFGYYAFLVAVQLQKMGYKPQIIRFCDYVPFNVTVFREELFAGWHNDRYYRQCYYNLQEKYDCGGITEEEWRWIDEAYRNKISSTFSEVDK